MSTWRVKGFVQDSDEEEDEIELSPASSNRDSQHSSDGRDSNTATGGNDTGEKSAEAIKETASELEERLHAGGIPSSSRLHDEGQFVRDEPTTVTHVVGDVPQTPRENFPLIDGVDSKLREPTESPDPLLGSPTPKAHHVGKSSWSSQILGGPNLSERPANTIKNKNAGRKLDDDILAPLSDSSESDLSDPPSDLEDLRPTETVFNSPTRRTTMQVVIRRSTAPRTQQPPLFEPYIERSFRQRKPIQLHPYLLEGERYRRDLQGRGVKPVARVLSPSRKTRQGDQESQEQDFDPNNDLTPSTPPEIFVSTPKVRQRTGSSRGFSSLRRRIRTQTRDSPPLAHNTKRRKVNGSLHARPSNHEGGTTENVMSDVDVWRIPQSPPYSSSPPINHSGLTIQQPIRALTMTPAPNLPTPTDSSSLLAPLDVDSDDEEPIVRSTHRPGQRVHEPISIPSDRLSSDTESSESEAQASDNEVRKVGKKIRGVLPASWLRLDLQAQEKRNKRMKERLNTLKSPESVEPQRGVAHKVIRRRGTSPRTKVSNSPADCVIEISDESDSEVSVHAPPVSGFQESATAALGTAAMLNRRYADDDSDTMENDRLHLFTLGGTSRKRKAQSKLTDAFTASKKTKLSVNGGTRSQNNSSKRYNNFPKRRRTPPPALSVLDLDLSPSEDKALPQFLRIARRQARRRPDHARESPTHKYIRLHTVQDTEDANSTLRDWNRGVIKPKPNARRPEVGIASRTSLDLDRDQQGFQRLQPGSSAAIELKEQTGPTEQGARIRARQTRPSGLIYFHRKEPGTAKRFNLDNDSSFRRRPPILRRRKNNTLPFRPAQLESLAPDGGASARRIAFEKGLQRVDRQFNFQQPFPQSFQNPQIARFLADDDIVLPPLSPRKDVEEPVQEQVPKVNVRNRPVPKRRLKRKPQAQRIDVDTREFRQPSEPVVDNFLKAVTNIQAASSEQKINEQDLLQGLGPYGTRYSTTFDVTPLQYGTYFHVSTFVGSEALYRALATSEDGARNLDEPAGYYTLDLIGNSVRCGPWEDAVFSHLQNATNNIWNDAVGPTGTDDLSTPHGCSLDKASSIIHSLIDYISRHLSFHDPIDRNSFVGKMEQWALSLFESIMSHGFADTKSMPTPKTKPLALLLVLCTQIRKIAQQSAIKHSINSNNATIILSISKSLVGDLLDHVSEVSEFLENNKRYIIRENGIRGSDVIVEGLVICMHTLRAANVPGTAFWELVGQSLSPTAKRATHLAEFEAVWGTVFTLLPLIEFNRRGLPVRTRRISFMEDNWALIRALVQRLFVLYPETSKTKTHNASLNDYVRAVLTRCHELMYFWHWTRCELVLYAMFDFFVAKNGLKHLRHEHNNGSAFFLEQADNQSCSRIETNEKSFHIFLKCLFVGIQGMQGCYTEKKLRSVVLRLIPNHGRSYPKDQPLEKESLEALNNHHDILCTLYRASPSSCRPKLELIKALVDHENSHREACRISVHAWANLSAFQLSTKEPYTHLQPLAEWHKEILTKTLKQYRLAKTEIEDFIKSGSFDNSEATSLMVRQTIEKNQEQVVAALRGCAEGMLKAVGVSNSQVSLRGFLVNSGLIGLLELPHLQDQRLVVVIRDALGVLRAFARLPREIHSVNSVPERSEESQESQQYGDPLELDDFMGIDQAGPPPDDFLQIPLWHLLSNAFGAESALDDNLLMDCIDTWCLIARCQVSMGAHSWTYYLDPFSRASWHQLRRTEQTQKFAPYFMASVLICDPTAYLKHRIDFLNALLVSLVERESMLRFQHRLLSAITRAYSGEPLLKNLPFFRKDDTSSLDITTDTLRTRRLALISSILANMRDDFHNTMYENPGCVAEVRGNYATILKDFMSAMKNNYQQLGSGNIVTGAYVEFVQKVVQFLQQYTADIHPVLDFFTNSVAFPLPAADPTYVVGRLCGYAPKLSRVGTAKQLSVFIQTVAQQAVTGDHQLYLAHQLQTALCTDEAPARDRIGLRNVLLQGIFPAYVETAFTSTIGYVIAKPILQVLVPIVETMAFDLRVFDEANVRATCDCLLSIVHAFVRSTEHLKENEDLLKEPHILQFISLGFRTMVTIFGLLEYICGRCSDSSSKPPVIMYFEQLALFIVETLHGIEPQTIPFYSGDANGPDTTYSELLSFSVEGLGSGMKTNWSSYDNCLFFGQGHARREVFSNLGNTEEEKANLVTVIEAFLAGISVSGAEPELMERDDFMGGINV